MERGKDSLPMRRQVRWNICRVAIYAVATFEFFAKNGHTIVPSLVPSNDLTLLFNRGMVQFKDVSGNERSALPSGHNLAEGDARGRQA